MFTAWGHGVDMHLLMDGLVSASHGSNFIHPFPKPLTSEEREEKIARQPRIDAILRQRFPLKRAEGTFQQKPSGEAGSSDAA